MSFANLALPFIGTLWLGVPVLAQDAASIRPFRFCASDEALADLRRRIAATRWPDKETVGNQSHQHKEIAGAISL